MAPQELRERNLPKLKAICKDLFKEYAIHGPACSEPRKNVERQQKRFSTVFSDSFTTSFACDTTQTLVMKQLDVIQDNLEFALYNTEFPSKLEVPTTLHNTQRWNWIQELEGTPSEALEAVASAIDRLTQIKQAIQQISYFERPKYTPEATHESIPLRTLRRTTVKFMDEPDKVKSVEKKQAHISSKTSSYNAKDGMSNIVGEDDDFSAPSFQEQAQSLQRSVDNAKAQFHKGNYQDAVAEYREALNLHSEYTNFDQSWIVLIKGSLANALAKQGKQDEAEALYVETWELSSRIHEETHPHTLASRINLASMHEKRGRHEEAVEVYRDVLRLQKATVGPSDLYTLSTSNRLANALVRLGEFSKAEVMYKETLEVHTRELREHYPNRMITLGNLANALGNQGRFQEAKVEYLRAKKLGMQILNPGHPYLDWLEIRLKALEDNGE